MTVLINLAFLALVATPFVVGWLGWKYWSSPAASYTRRVNKLHKQIDGAIANGNFSKAHALAYALTGLRRSKDPSAPEFRPPDMKGFYDLLAADDPDLTNG